MKTLRFIVAFPFLAIGTLLEHVGCVIAGPDNTALPSEVQTEGELHEWNKRQR